MDFCFQLTEEDILRSQIATSRLWGGRRYLPYVYTEQGIIALAGALHSGVAEHMAVEISRVFISMRRFILKIENVIQRVVGMKIVGYGFLVVFLAIKNGWQFWSSSVRRLGCH